jgi:hypothetical protein
MPGSLPDERILRLTGWRLQEHREMTVLPATATMAFDVLSIVEGMSASGQPRPSCGTALPPHVER